MVSSQNHAGENESYGVMINYYLKNKIDSEVKICIYDGQRLIRTLEGAGLAGLNRVEWKMNTVKECTPEERAQLDEEYQWFIIEPYTKFQQV